MYIVWASRCLNVGNYRPTYLREVLYGKSVRALDQTRLVGLPHSRPASSSRPKSIHAYNQQIPLRRLFTGTSSFHLAPPLSDATRAKPSPPSRDALGVLMNGIACLNQGFEAPVSLVLFVPRLLSGLYA